MKMLLAAFLLNRAAEETYGGTPAPFDILGLSANFIASGEGLTTNEWLRTVMDNGWERLTGERLFDTDPAVLGGDFDWAAAAEDLSYNVSNDIPYLRNVTGLLGLGDETLPLPDLYGAGEGIVNAIANDGLYPWKPLLPWALQRRSSCREAGRRPKRPRGLQPFCAADDTVATETGHGCSTRWREISSTWCGHSCSETPPWRRRTSFTPLGESGLSAAQTRLYNDLVSAGADGMELYRGIQDYRAVNGDEALSSLEKGKQERDIIRALNLTDEQKLTLYQGLTGADSRAEKFQALMGTGMTWDEVMDAYDRYAELDADETMRATEKATELARWADEWYQEDQAAAIKEQLAFFLHHPGPGRAVRRIDRGGAGRGERLPSHGDLRRPGAGEGRRHSKQYAAVPGSGDVRPV